MNVFVPGSFDDIRSPDVRLLQEAARLGTVTVLLWSDAAFEKITGRVSKFNLAERVYFIESLYFVEQVFVLEDALDLSSLTVFGNRGQAGGETEKTAGIICVDREHDFSAYAAYCGKRGVLYRVFAPGDLNGYPVPGSDLHSPSFGKPRVVVTGCYDWFHSGHIRFFEEASAYGELHVVLGTDANIALLKGPEHPMYSETERKYLVQSVKFVEEAYIATGSGWLDAEPEIRRIKPAIYAVNEDGDKPVKRDFCEQNGIEYIVMKRKPKKGLPKRTSTDLRGF